MLPLMTCWTSEQSRKWTEVQVSFSDFYCRWPTVSPSAFQQWASLRGMGIRPSGQDTAWDARIPHQTDLGSSVNRTPNSRFQLTHALEGSRWWLKQLGPCYPPGKPRVSFYLLALPGPALATASFGEWVSRWGHSLIIILSLSLSHHKLLERTVWGFLLMLQETKWGFFKKFTRKMELKINLYCKNFWNWHI